MISLDRSARRWLAEMAAVRALASSTELHHEYALNAFEAWFGRVASLADVADGLSAFVKFRADRYAAHGVRTQRGALLTLLRFAEDAGAVEIPRRIRNVRLVDLQPTWFSDGEIRRLLVAADPYQAAAIWLARCGAMRRGDLLWRLCWSQVGGDGVIRWVMGKPGRSHAVRLFPNALAACQRIRDGKDDRLVPWPFSKSGWHRRWQCLGRRAGVNVHRRGLQAIRRVAASLVAKEHGEHAAARLLGHSSASGVAVFRQFYAVGFILDSPPPSPPPLDAP